MKTDSKENTPPRSTSHIALISSVCEKVATLPSTAKEADLVPNVEDCVAVLFKAMFTPDDKACNSNIWICSPVVDSSLTFLASG
jgi:hypothetical protein